MVNVTCPDCRALLTVVREYVCAHDAFFSGPRHDSDDLRYELNVAENRLWALVRTQRPDGSWEPREGEGKP